jgi:hypothetical protein
MPYALCPMPYALCPMAEAYLIFLRKAIGLSVFICLESAVDRLYQKFMEKVYSRLRTV